MSYIILRGRWCDIIVLNVQVPTENKIEDVKDRFYEELEQLFDKFPKYHRKICLGDISSKYVGRTFSNQQLGMSVYTKLEIIMEIE
jgi:hypothetical protein